MPNIVPRKDAWRDTGPRVEPAGYSDSLSFLYDRINYERMSSGTSRYPFRLNRMRQLLQSLDLQQYLYDPDRFKEKPSVPIVHIAGTKGKGSTSSMVAAALSAGGIRTGLYTSPHLHHLEERFRVDGQPCEPTEIVTLVDRLKSVLQREVERNLSAPAYSFFELTTAMALMHFDTRDCDAVVLEVGLGGRLDSTNVCSPVVTAITPIGLDHQHVLGSTLTQIATEKSGIIKHAIPVVCGVSAKDDEQSEVLEVIVEKAKQQSAPTYLLDRDFSFESEAKSEWGSHVDYRGHKNPLADRASIDLPLEGHHQASNAAVAMAIVDLLRERGVEVCTKAACDGISGVRCEARIERMILPEDTVVIVDAAHNENSIEALCQTIRQRRDHRSVHFVFGTSLDKSAAEMLNRIAEEAGSLVLTQFAGNPRFAPTEDLLPLVPSSIAGNTQIAKDPIDACRLGLRSASPGGMMVVCGSFFLAAETRQWLLRMQK